MAVNRILQILQSLRSQNIKGKIYNQIRAMPKFQNIEEKK